MVISTISIKLVIVQSTISQPQLLLVKCTISHLKVVIVKSTISAYLSGKIPSIIPNPKIFFNPFPFCIPYKH